MCTAAVECFQKHIELLIIVTYEKTLYKLNTLLLLLFIIIIIIRFPHNLYLLFIYLFKRFSLPYYCS